MTILKISFALLLGTMVPTWSSLPSIGITNQTTIDLQPEHIQAIASAVIDKLPSHKQMIPFAALIGLGYTSSTYGLSSLNKAYKSSYVVENETVEGKKLRQKRYWLNTIAGITFLGGGLLTILKAGSIIKYCTSTN